MTLAPYCSTSRTMATCGAAGRRPLASPACQSQVWCAGVTLAPVRFFKAERSSSWNQASFRRCFLERTKRVRLMVFVDFAPKKSTMEMIWRKCYSLKIRGRF
uniref:(northern house mosquito) hypothetical protein n=1 Tax=Culex pipiens TaxID=7175 RepID=A0A8D8EZK5_CULPI